MNEITIRCLVAGFTRWTTRVATWALGPPT